MVSGGLVLWLGTAFVGGLAAERRRSGPSGPAHSFHLENVRVDARPVDLAEYHGQPLILNFWASWCTPCQREMPTFEAVSEDMADQVSFLGVNHQDRRSDALAALSHTGVRYASGYDPEGEVAVDYGLFGMPSTVFISAAGEVLERRTGEMSRQDLERTIERLFSP